MCAWRRERTEAGPQGRPGQKQLQDFGHLNLELVQAVGPMRADKDSRLGSRLQQSERTVCLTFGSHPMRPQPLPGNGQQRQANGMTDWRRGRAWPGGPAPGSAGLGRSQARVRWSRACGEAGRAGRGGEGAASGRRARAARAGGSRGGARPPARAPGGGHCAALLSAVRARGAHRASAALARPACPGPTCGGRRGRGAPSAAEPHEQ